MTAIDLTVTYHEIKTQAVLALKNTTQVHRK